MASGSVVEQWVWLLRFSRWKFTVGFEPSPVPVVGGWLVIVNTAKALLSRPCLQQGSIHGEVLIREQIRAVVPA